VAGIKAKTTENGGLLLEYVLKVGDADVSKNHSAKINELWSTGTDYSTMVGRCI